MKKYEMDMCSGNIFVKMIKFSIPLMLTGILQLLYNAADLIIVANFSDKADALGAVGSTGSITNLLVNLFMGLSVGTNVLVAKKFASRQYDELSKVIHTSILISLISGTIMGIFGVVFAGSLMKMMNNPIPLATVYLRIYFIGLPFNLLYNFAAAILRAIGDTKRPLYFLSIAGLANVVLNLFFVIVLKMDVDGVAIATVISEFISAVLIMICLIRTKEAYKFEFKKCKISGKELKQIIRVGIPAGLQSSLFSVSNVLIQSSVNAFGATVINGNSAASSLEGFTYTAMDSVYQAGLSFTSQNVGAKKSENLNKVLLYALIIVTLVGMTLGGLTYLFREPLIHIYTKVPAEVDVAVIRFKYLVLIYWLCGIMDVTCGVIRGMGYAITPMVVSLLGACAFRILWIIFCFNPFVDFSNIKYLNLLYISYPISWILTFIVHLICYFVLKPKVVRQMKIEESIDLD